MLDELALVDGSHSELPLDGGDERWPLEERPLQPFQLPGHPGPLDGLVEAVDADVLLAGTLLGFDQPEQRQKLHFSVKGVRAKI